MAYQQDVIYELNSACSDRIVCSSHISCENVLWSCVIIHKMNVHRRWWLKNVFTYSGESSLKLSSGYTFGSGNMDCVLVHFISHLYYGWYFYPRVSITHAQGVPVVRRVHLENAASRCMLCKRVIDAFCWTDEKKMPFSKNLKSQNYTTQFVN